MSEPRFPVEPLSERRWQDLRRKVLAEAALTTHAPTPPRVGHARLVIVSLAAAAAVALAWFGPSMHAPPPSASTTRVVTDASSARASAGDATLDLAAHTSVLVIERAPDDWLVSLEHGTAHFSVPPRRVAGSAARPVFTVEAGRTRVEVLGTGFTVTREPGATSASVSVDHGTVRVTDESAEVLLQANESWPSRAPQAAQTDGPAAIAAPPSPVETASAAVGAPSVAHVTPRAPAPDAPTPPPITADAEPSGVATAAPSPARDRYHAAQALEASDSAQALALYAALADESGAYAAQALIAEARLEDELHHHDRARALAQRYLRRYPDGLNAEDARVLLADPG